VTEVTRIKQRDGTITEHYLYPNRGIVREQAKQPSGTPLVCLECGAGSEGKCRIKEAETMTMDGQTIKIGEERWAGMNMRRAKGLRQIPGYTPVPIDEKYELSTATDFVYEEVDGYVHFDPRVCRVINAAKQMEA
jgi:hypothetical protein